MKCKGGSIKDDKFNSIALGVVVGAMLIILALCIVISSMRPKGGEAQRYDLDCLTEPKAKPLTECKE